jgi:hypothetical protein
MKQTLPTWARDWPWSLDVIRKVMRRLPELQQLGEWHGATRLLTESEAEQIRKAMELRENAKYSAP